MTGSSAVAPGERCARRDLPLDLHRALQPEGIRLMLYLPCQTPNADRRAQRAFGLPEGRKDQPINEEFAHKWAKVIHEWSSRYGDKVAGWWFDGGYQHIHFNEAIARIYADAVKRGNPRAIVTFNPGVKLVRHTRAEDYTAGELNEPFDCPPDLALGGRLAMARADIPGFLLGPTRHAPADGTLGPVGASSGGERRRSDARPRPELGLGSRPDRDFRRGPGRPGQSHPPGTGGSRSEVKNDGCPQGSSRIV